MTKCIYCGKSPLLTGDFNSICSECRSTPTVSTNTITITPHDKLLALGWKKIDELKYEKILKQNNYQKIFVTINLDKKTKTFIGTWNNYDYFNENYASSSLSFDLELAKILVEYLEKIEENK